MKTSKLKKLEVIVEESLNDGNVKNHTLTRLDAMIRASSGKRLTHEELTQ